MDAPPSAGARVLPGKGSRERPTRRKACVVRPSYGRPGPSAARKARLPEGLMKSSRFVVAAGTILAVSLGSSAGRADTPRDSAGAEALFAEGRRLMVAGDYAKACP